MYKPRTANEYNIFHINRLLKSIKKGKISVRDAKLNERFDRLKKSNVGMYEELYPQYINLVKGLNKDF